MNITRENSGDLGYVLWCLACEAINMDEFRKWVLHVIEILDEPPGYMIDLADFNGYMMKDIDGIVGFTSDWSPSEETITAISGIAILRGIEPYEPVDTYVCNEALTNNGHVLERFRELFPFIQVPA